MVQSASFTKLFSTKVYGVGVLATADRERDGDHHHRGSEGLRHQRHHGGHQMEPLFRHAVRGLDHRLFGPEPDIGSTSTPVVNPATGIIYLTTRTETGKGGLASPLELQALSSSTGKEAAGFPVTITGTPYNTPGVPFNQAYALQRTALLLLDGTVYMGFASDCDFTPYRGIVVGVSTTTHAITTMWSDESGIGTNQNSQAGIWQSGGGLVSDETVPDRPDHEQRSAPQPAPSNKPPKTLSESVIGLTVGSNGRITPTQFFAPSNAANLDAQRRGLGRRWSHGPAHHPVRHQSAPPSPGPGGQGRPDLPGRRG